MFLWILVDHFYTSWGNWSACNATCGYGTKQRLRKCTFLPKYPPENPNPICISPEKDYQYLSCYDKSCKSKCTPPLING